MREAIDKDDEGAFDLFSDDEQLQGLLKETSDTEPILAADIENWLNPEATANQSKRRRTRPTSMMSCWPCPPSRSWLDDDDDEDADIGALHADDPNRLNAELIDSWQSELGEDDDDDDPYVDWLSDAPVSWATN